MDDLSKCCCLWFFLMEARDKVRKACNGPPKACTMKGSICSLCAKSIQEHFFKRTDSSAKLGGEEEETPSSP